MTAAVEALPLSWPAGKPRTALTVHPDAGGSVAAMQELTEARSKLRGGA